MATTLWSDFNDDVLSEIPGVLPAFAQHHVKLAAIEFCERSWVWLADQGPILIEAAKNIYPLPGREDDAVHLVLPGTTGNSASTSDSVPNSVTGDIELEWDGSPAVDWKAATLPGNATLISKGFQDSYWFAVTAVSAAGTSPLLMLLLNGVGYNSTVILPWSHEGATRHKVKVTRSAATGNIKFYTWDGATWVQLGATVPSTPGAIFDNPDLLYVGINAGAAYPWAGRVYRATVRNGIGGPVVVDFDPSRFTAGAVAPGATARMVTSETWTLNGTAATNIQSAVSTVARVQQVWLDKKPLLPKTRNELSDLYGDYMRADGPPVYFVQDTPGKLIVVPTPTGPSSGDGLTAKVVIAPTRAAVGIETEIFNRYHDQISRGAKARLFGIAKKPWTDFDKSIEQKAMFEDAISEAKTNVIRSYAGARLRNRAQFY